MHLFCILTNKINKKKGKRKSKWRTLTFQCYSPGPHSKSMIGPICWHFQVTCISVPCGIRHYNGILLSGDGSCDMWYARHEPRLVRQTSQQRVLYPFQVSILVPCTCDNTPMQVAWYTNTGFVNGVVFVIRHLARMLLALQGMYMLRLECTGRPDSAI